jgi:hypothetical protein
MTVLKSLILPILAGGGLICICWMLPPIRKWTWLANCAFGLAISIAAFGSWTAENGLPSFPPEEMAQWLGVFAVCAMVAAMVASATGTRTSPVTELTAVITGGLVALAPIISEQFKGKEQLFADMQVADYLGIGLAVALGYLVLTPIAEKRQGTLLPVVFCLAFGGLAPLADAAGWITLTFLCAAVSGTCFFAALAARFGGSPTVGRGGILAAVILLSIFSVACFRQGYPEFPWWCLLLVAGSPLILLPLDISLLDKFPCWVATLLRVGGVVVLVGLGLLFGLTGGEADVDPMSLYQ